MALILKNTFISFATEDTDAAHSEYASPRMLVRSQSAEISRSRPIDEEGQKRAQQALQRLTAVLSEGLAPPAPRPREGPPEGFLELQTQAPQQGPAKSARSPVQKATRGAPRSPAQEPWDRRPRAGSSCSLSTMAPDDASQCGSVRYQRGSSGRSLNSLDSDETSEDSEAPSAGSKKVPRVWSSSSVSSMVSDAAADKVVDEHGQVQFRLSGLDDEGEARAEAQAGAPAKPQCGRIGNNATIIHEGDMTHSRVPKTHNLAELYNKDSAEEPPTTMMIRNIPGRYSQHDLMMDLSDLGLGGTYNFLYLPMDKGTSASVGYAFVNFVDASFAVKCMQVFSSYRFQRRGGNAQKAAAVSVAHLQGLERNLQHYENAAVSMSKEKRRRPVVMANIAQIVE